MLTKSRLIQLLSMLCLLIGLFVWRTTDLLMNNNDQIGNNEFNIDEGVCDFTGACLFNSPVGAFSLSVDEGEIIPEEWFHLTLKSDLDNWKVVSAKTIGKVMFMGKIPIKFTSVSEADGQQQAKAKSMLGSCTENKMLWQFNIIVDVDGKLVNLTYDFLIVK